jgi:hypothetical protein
MSIDSRPRRRSKKGLPFLAVLGLQVLAIASQAMAASRQDEFVNLDGSITVRPEIRARDFKGPTNSQSAELALHKLDEANDALKALGPGPVENCTGPKIPVVRNGQKSSVAICTVTDEELADYEKQFGKEIVTWEFSTGNDAKPGQVGTKVTGDGKAGKQKSDDVGRTFDIAAKRRVSKADGYSEVRFNSVSFGQRQQPTEAQRSESFKHPLMKIFNVTSLAVENTSRLPGEDLGASDFVVDEGSIEVSTGSAKSPLGTELQHWFHKTTESGPIYQYVEHDKTRVRAVLKKGLQRLAEGDLGQFHCRMVATALVGIGTDGKPLAEARLGGMINTGTLGGRTSENPWIQLDGYRKHLIRPGSRPEDETSLRISTSANIFGANVKPFISVARHDSDLDRKYAAGSRDGYKAPYYTMGVMVQWK